MTDYPKLDDDNFQKKILKKFNKYKIIKQASFKDTCFPKKWTYQLPQLFVSQFINPSTPYKGLLVYHKIGAGKTCAAVQIAEQWKGKRNIIFSCPASLITNFYKELKSGCTGDSYISQKDKELLNKLDPEDDKVLDIHEKAEKIIDKYYTILSYNKLVSQLKKKKIDLNNSIIIIDEVQNIVSENGTMYKTIYDAIHKASSNLRVVLLSATPIFDKPSELALTMNLLRPKEELPTGSEFNEMFIKTQLSTKINKYEIQNKDILSDYLNGYISYYQGAPDYTFPERIEKIIKCPMSKYQYNCYKTVEESEGGFADANDIFKMPNNFLLGSRMISNIAFPNKYANEQGYNAFTKNHMSLENLSNYSSKFSYLMNKILSKSGLHFVYSNFKSYAGIKTITKILKYHGYKNYSKDGPGKLRYAIWSGDESIQEKEMIRNVFNHPDNVNGSKIKIIIGSPAIKEGVTLLRVKYVHVLEPYWNMSRYEQVIGRAIRFCSHKDIEKDKRKVKVYLYLATPPEDILKKDKNISTVDEHILKLALRKKQIIDQFETVIKESAVDYYLNQ